MEREIKFRAWDGKNMNYDVTIFNGRFIDCSCADEDIFYKWHDPSEQVAIMQYTGLKDKNGKEIYEGDIVKQMFPDFDWDDDDNNPKKRWNEKVSAIVYREHGFWVEDEDFGWEGENLWNWEIMEVIGNIYEHPELLKEAVK